MLSDHIKIALLGATGHIGKNLMLHFSKDKKYELSLFSRDTKKIRKIINDFYPICNFSINSYEDFDNLKYDIIINCIGIGDPKKIQDKGSSILKISEYYDNKVLNYLENNPSALYINLSSGAVYGEAFTHPVGDSTPSTLNINDQTSGYFYSIAKLYSEAKHRSLSTYNIADLRVFGFFSRFIDLSHGFFLSEVISALKGKNEFVTNSDNIIRDFIHPEDLHLLIERCIVNKPINDAFDVYSKAPISKFEILDSLSQRYGLEYVLKEDTHFSSPTGIKMNYYSTSKKAEKIGYFPKYSSLETITGEIEFILNI